MIKRIVLVLLIMSYCSCGFAFDISFVPIDKALKSGRVVLVGFVRSISVVDRSLGKVSAHADIVVEECLKGNSCNKGKNIGIDYLAQTVEGSSLPIKLLAGVQVIVILNGLPRESVYEFDSDINGGTDFVFICNAFPYSILDEHSIFKCQDSMTGKESSSLSLEDVKEVLLN